LARAQPFVGLLGLLTLQQQRQILRERRRRKMEPAREAPKKEG